MASLEQQLSVSTYIREQQQAMKNECIRQRSIVATRLFLLQVEGYIEALEREGDEGSAYAIRTITEDFKRHRINGSEFGRRLRNEIDTIQTSGLLLKISNNNKILKKNF
jgi:hypothetical protein